MERKTSHSLPTCQEDPGSNAQTLPPTSADCLAPSLPVSSGLNAIIKQLLPALLRVRGLAPLARGSPPPNNRAVRDGAGAGREEAASVQQGLDGAPLGAEEASVLFSQDAWGWGGGPWPGAHSLGLLSPPGQGVTISASQNLLCGGFLTG